MKKIREALEEELTQYVLPTLEAHLIEKQRNFVCSE